MPKNTAGLKQSARRRSEQAVARALAALQRMDASEQVINFRTVATEAKVSTAWLYRQQELRLRIMRSRRTTNHRVVLPESASQERERLSRQNVVATLRLRIEALEEKNRELTEQLERAYGVIAQTQVSSSP
jgi:membrane-bound lytic murein transglycosylase B